MQKTHVYTERLARLGKHAKGVGCLYIKDLNKVDLSVLEAIIDESHRKSHRRHPRAPCRRVPCGRPTP